MNILFTVCGRAGSKGVKNKNLKTFLGEPLVYYTMASIDLFIKRNKNKYNIDVSVNTDDQNLIKLAEETNLNVISIKRDPNLAEDDTPKVSVIRDALDKCENKKNYKYDVIVDLDITSPLRTVVDIENAVEKKINNRDIDIVFSVVESRRNPYFNMVKENDGIITRVIDSNYTARQQAPNIYDMNASIYAYSRDYLIDKVGKDFFDAKVGITNMLETGILDIDSERDFELMQVVAEYLFNTNEGMKEVSDNIRNIYKDRF